MPKHANGDDTLTNFINRLEQAKANKKLEMMAAQNSKQPKAAPTSPPPKVLGDRTSEELQKLGHDMEAPPAMKIEEDLFLSSSNGNPLDSVGPYAFYEAPSVDPWVDKKIKPVPANLLPDLNFGRETPGPGKGGLAQSLPDLHELDLNNDKELDQLCQNEKDILDIQQISMSLKEVCQPLPGLNSIEPESPMGQGVIADKWAEIMEANEQQEAPRPALAPKEQLNTHKSGQSHGSEAMVIGEFENIQPIGTKEVKHNSLQVREKIRTRKLPDPTAKIPTEKNRTGAIIKEPAPQKVEDPGLKNNVIPMPIGPTRKIMPMVAPAQSRRIGQSIKVVGLGLFILVATSAIFMPRIQEFTGEIKKYSAPQVQHMGNIMMVIGQVMDVMKNKESYRLKEQLGKKLYVAESMFVKKKYYESKNRNVISICNEILADIRPQDPKFAGILEKTNSMLRDVKRHYVQLGEGNYKKGKYFQAYQYFLIANKADLFDVELQYKIYELKKLLGPSQIEKLERDSNR
jgi:hypothetical protein